MPLRVPILAFLCGLLLVPTARAYSVSPTRWTTSTATMHLQLGANASPLSDGFASWDASAEDALSVWNSHLANFRFVAVRNSTATRARGNRINNVAFAPDVYGQAWGSNVLAVTLTFFSGAVITETDVLFNNRLSWDSYRGALRGSVQDFHRVALHEFGHALGLDHPDENGQAVSALMNSRVSSLDALTADDIAGGQSLYGVPASTTPPVTAPPATPPVVATPPEITVQPVPQVVAVGERAQFSVTALGTPAPTYRWLRDGVELAGATLSSLTIDAVRSTDAGVYSVRVTNSQGSVTSSAATLTLRFSRLANLSTRGLVPPGGTLTPGFVIRGTAPKPLLIRAVGPTLSSFGVDSALDTTQLDLIAQESGAVVASNNDWGGTAALRDAFASVGAFPLAPDSKDAAVQTRLEPQAYTVRIASEDSSSSGITLAEIYDADPSQRSAQLINVSTLGFVGSGENVLTAGFVIAGNSAKRLLIRAVGPGLTSFGVPDVLPDPQLGLIPLGHVEPLATNDDWVNNSTTRAAFTAAGAFTLASDSKDAALVITLQPGGYTVVVSSVDGTTTGQALVEIYDLDP
ncbi:MAG: immunoglobulin domain-containing protein [Verrucomicrobiota bacterium]